MESWYVHESPRQKIFIHNESSALIDEISDKKGYRYHSCGIPIKHETLLCLFCDTYLPCSLLRYTFSSTWSEFDNVTSVDFN